MSLVLGSQEGWWFRLIEPSRLISASQLVSKRKAEDQAACRDMISERV